MVHIVNPFRKVTCPYCNRSYYPGECTIIATLPYINVEVGDTFQEGRKGLLARSFVNSLTGPDSVKVGAVRICPHCNMKQPHNFMSSHSYIIAIVGDVNSGKSHYLASCIHQLLQRPIQQFIGCSAIIGQGNTDQTYNSNYFVPCIMGKKKLSSTQPGVVPEPLIYELVFPDKSVNLLFYDASGEDMINPSEMAQYSHYIFNASAIIFLADPMSMPGVVNALPTHLQSGSQRALSSGQALNRVIATFRQNLVILPGEKLKIPIAITISKSDLLEFVVPVTNTPSYLREHSLSNAIDIVQSKIINQEVQNFLRRFGEPILLKASETFETASFFAVSATSWPEDPNGKFPSIEPRRCVDPLLWILWELGVIAPH